MVLSATAAWVARPPRVTVAGSVVMAGVALVGVLSLLSSAWAGSAENAVISGNRYLTYAALLALLVAVVRSRTDAALALAGFTAAALVVAGVDLAQILGGGAPDLFLNRRLNAPLGYINGQANFFLIAAWPCIALSQLRRSPLAGALGLAAASSLVGLMLLGQSRGAVLACLVAIVVVVGFARSRLRLAAALALVAAGAGVALPAILDVFDASRREVSEAAARGAAQSILIVAAVVGVLAFLALTVERRLADDAPRLHRRARLSLAVVVAAIGAGAIGGLVAEAGPIRHELSAQYHAFVELTPTHDSKATRNRLTSGGGNRYDYWRVAATTFGDHPVAGVGAGNYTEPYFLLRHTTEDVRQPHSIELQTLSELGVVGALVLVAILIAAALVFARWRRRGADSEAERVLFVAAVGMVVAWLAHTSVDWMHLLPGLSAAAMIAVAMAIRGARDEAPEATAAAPRSGTAPRVCRVLVVALAALALAVTGISLARQTLSDWYRLKAQDALAASPAKSLEEADRSLRIDPDAVPSYYVKAAAVARLGDADATERILAQAIAREPRNFLSYALLGDVYARERRFDLARSAYADALARNPRSAQLRALVEDPRSATRGAG
jgi:hypothetical protein